MPRDDGQTRPASSASRNLSQRRLFQEDPDYRENSPRGVRDRAAATLGLCLAVVVCCGSCAHLGPRTIPVDRFDYSTAVAESWKEQALLNIVKMRYADLPTFVDVSSIVSGYSLQTGVNVGGTVSSQRAVQGNFVTAGAQAIYTDRPTITYLPLTGEKFLRGLLMPIDPKNIFFLLQSGYTVDFMGLTVESLNGVRNRSVTGGTIREADPAFVRVLQLLSEIQAAGVVGMRVDEDKARGSIGVLLFRRADLPTDIADKAAEVRRLLKLSPDREQFVLTYSPARGAENELAVNSRSMLQIMAAFSSYLDAPEEHLRDHSVLPSPEPAAQTSGRDGVRIRSGKDKPAHAFVAVPYRDYWFWIDDGDLKTKRALMAINFFFTLAGTGAADRLPLITIPAQ
jgi:hypothetical protein